MNPVYLLPLISVRIPYYPSCLLVSRRSAKLPDNLFKTARVTCLMSKAEGKVNSGGLVAVSRYASLGLGTCTYSFRARITRFHITGGSSSIAICGVGLNSPRLEVQCVNMYDISHFTSRKYTQNLTMGH